MIVDEMATDLIRKILRVNPENRPEVKEILSHQYFYDYHFEKKSNSGVSTVGSPMGDFDEQPLKMVKSFVFNPLGQNDLTLDKNKKRQNRLRSEQINPEHLGIL